MGPHPWVFQVCSRPNVEVRSRSLSCSSQSESESDEDEGLDSNSRDENDGEAQSDLKDSNSKDEEYEEMQSDLIGHDLEQGRMDSDPESQDLADGKTHGDVNSQENIDEEIHSDENIEGSASMEEDVSPSLSGCESVSTVDDDDDDDDDEEVTGTFHSMNGTTPGESSRKNVKQSVPRACTSTTTESHESDSVITKFEGLDIRSDSVPTLQKIWRKHGNIIENSSMRSGYIVARALEALATMIRILEENTAESLSDCQADYLSSTLSDLRCICFNVSWLIPFVERAVKLHKSKSLVDSLNNLSQLSSQVRERIAIVLDEVAKLNEEQNKLTEVMAKVSKFIPFTGEVKFHEPVGSGLT